MAARKRPSVAAAEPPEVVAPIPDAPRGLAALGDDVRRVWRQWRARGGDGTWRRVLETGFVPYARSLGLDVPDALDEGQTVATIDDWAADALAREHLREEHD